MKYQLIPYSSKYKLAFKELNQEWLEKFFYVEEFDREVLANPSKYIIEPGGQIYFAIVNDQAVGVIGLMPNQNYIEITKMAVSPNFQGYGIGRALFERAILGAHELGFKRVHIFTNTKLHRAFNLYRKIGFSEIAFNTNQYARCNSRLEKYIVKNLSPEEINVALEDYLYSNEVLEKLLNSIPKEAYTYQPANGGWTIEDQISHLLDSEVVSYALIRRFLNQELINDFSWSSNAWIENSNKKTLGLSETLHLLKQLRVVNYNTLKSIDYRRFADLKAKYNGKEVVMLDWMLGAKNHNHFGQITRNHQEFLK